MIGASPFHDKYYLKEMESKPHSMKSSCRFNFGELTLCCAGLCIAIALNENLSSRGSSIKQTNPYPITFVSHARRTDQAWRQWLQECWLEPLLRALRFMMDCVAREHISNAETGLFVFTDKNISRMFFERSRNLFRIPIAFKFIIRNSISIWKI